MASQGATKKPDPNQEPHAPAPPNGDAVPVPAETAAREAAAKSAPRKAQQYTLIVRDVAGEMVLHFTTAEARNQARMSLIRRTPEGPIVCSRGAYWPSANPGAVAGCIIPDDEK